MFARAVSDHHRRGFIWVDDAANPASVLVYNPYGMYLLAGDPVNDAFARDVTKIMLNPEGKRHRWLHAYPQAWEAKLESLLGDRLVDFHQFRQEQNLAGEALDYAADQLARERIVKYGRTNFSFNPARFPDYHPMPLPAGTSIQSIDRILFDATEGQVVPKHLWDSYDDYTRAGMGYALVNGEAQPLALCFAAFTSGQEIEIGIETISHVRRRGFAGIVAAAMIEHCLKHGLSPVWSCRTENTGSYRLAQNLGFEIKFQLAYYECIRE